MWQCICHSVDLLSLINDFSIISVYTSTSDGIVSEQLHNLVNEWLAIDRDITLNTGMTFTGPSVKA
jgi:hypothetical protein